MLNALLLMTAIIPVNGQNGCVETTCLNPQFLPLGTQIIDGVAYANGYYADEWMSYYLGCDTDRPYNQQLDWRSTSLWYYYPPARLCGPYGETSGH